MNLSGFSLKQRIILRIANRLLNMVAGKQVWRAKDYGISTHLIMYKNKKIKND